METRKVLGQGNLLATTLTDIYLVPADTEAVVSSVAICNAGTSTTFRLSVAVAGATDDPKQYLYYDHAISANDTFESRLGISLGMGDVVRGYAPNNNVSVSVFGVEIA